MQLITIETQYLEPCDLAELTSLVREWAQVVALPPRTDETAYRQMIADAVVVIGSPRPEWILDTRLRLVQIPSAGYETYLGVGLETQQDLALCNGRGVFSIGIA